MSAFIVRLRVHFTFTILEVWPTQCNQKKEDKYKVPQGTIALMVIFIILIIALWGSAYLTMISRGPVG